MAEFSKQYVERNDSEFDAWDFDILEIAEELEPNHYTSIICEGFGFTAIGKDENGEIILAFPTGEYTEAAEDIEVEWKKLNTFIK